MMSSWVYLLMMTLALYSNCSSGSFSGSKQVIVVSYPGKNELGYYKKSRHDIAAFYHELDEKIGYTNDDLFIIYDDTGVHELDDYTFHNARLIHLPVSFDLWMRDFPTAIPEQPVKFKYRPDYLNGATARRTDDSFRNFLSKTLQVDQDISWSNIILDGGNIVENGLDKALITERVFHDNQDIPREIIKSRIEDALNRKVAILPDPGDTTGHADGFVSFLEKDVLLMCDFGNHTFYDLAEDAIQNEFPGLTVTTLPCYEGDAVFKGFISAEGMYANSLVTYDAVYMPVFSRQDYNILALNVIKANTRKQVVTVDTSKLAKMGGNIRCMTWQIDANHALAKALYNLADNQDNSK